VGSDHVGCIRDRSAEALHMDINDLQGTTSLLNVPPRNTIIEK
jgi:hypothetical protein